MADLNSRQNQFITDLKNFAQTLENAYGQAHALGQAYDEEFSTAQDNDLADADNLEATYSFVAADVAAAVNQAVDNFVNFWTGVAVGTREYGSDLRRIK